MTRLDVFMATASGRFKNLKTLLIASVLVFVLAAFIIACRQTPTLAKVQEWALGSDIVVLDAKGEFLQAIRTDYNKRRLAWFPLASFSESLQEAVVRAEDKRFFYHPGVDPMGLARAVKSLLSGGRKQGGSTITMQLSDLIHRETLLENKKIKKGAIFNKIFQIWKALLIELKWSKEEILEAYLNLIHLRGQYQGVPALSNAFLGKHPLALDRFEAVVIAKMIASPNRSAKSLSDKGCRLLKQIENSKDVDCEPVQQAAAGFFKSPPRLILGEDTAPHFARRLIREFPNQSILKSNIHSDLQKRVAAILENNIAPLKASNVNDAAAIVIENKTGNVIAYVGALKTSKTPYVDGVQAYRQAGSTLKPFLYAKAFELGVLSPASILIDDSTAISWNGFVYRPTNYDRNFYGSVSAREALASSLNVPAVKVVTILGLHQSYQVLQSIGLSNLKEPDFYGVSMALGAVDIRLDDIANAYRAFANQGMYSPLRFGSGAEEASSANSPHRIFSEEASYMASSVLSDASARTIGFGGDSPLNTAFWTVVKTGTSKDYRDNWCIGFSDQYTVAVWAGNFNSEAMVKVSGVSGAGPSWYDIMNVLHAQKRSDRPAPPPGIAVRKIRHQWESAERDEYFLSSSAPSHSLIETAEEKRVQFVFPVDGSTLVKDPHTDAGHIALFARFKGQIPAGSQLYWNDKEIGAAVSPFKMDDPPVGLHRLSIRSQDGTELSSVSFKVRN